MSVSYMRKKERERERGREGGRERDMEGGVRVIDPTK